MSWYLIEMPDGALTPYATETDELLAVADECDAADVDGVTDWAARIRKAVGE